jgi:RNA polymerase sigma-70 factor (ECF subfamily)
MNTTSVSLLQRLREPSAQDAWARFAELYTPLLYYWARRLGMAEEDAADLIQDLFATLVQKLPGFRYEPTRTFRGWLRTLLVNKWRDQRRRPGLALTSGPVPDSLTAPEAESLGEAEYREYLVRRALQVMQTEFGPKTWQACWQHVVEGRSAAEVGAALGISAGSVYVAKARVMTRLRQELAGLLD